jgi:hypothetical protein
MRDAVSDEAAIKKRALTRGALVAWLFLARGLVSISCLLMRLDLEAAISRFSSEKLRPRCLVAPGWEQRSE